MTENRTLWKSDNQGVKKKHSPRPVGGVEMGRRGRGLVARQLAGGPGWAKRWLEDQAVPHHVQINQEEQLGSRTDPTNQGSRTGIKASKPLTVKIYGGCGSGRNSQPHRRVHWRDPQGPRMYTKPPTQGISTKRAQFACG